MTMKNDPKFETELTSISKLAWGIWQILTRALENLKNLHFNGLLLTKVHNVWAKKVQNSQVWSHWILMQNLKENDSWFQKWHGNLANFHQSMFESLNIGTLMGSFYLKYKTCELKINRGLLCHENGEWCKIWRGIDLSVQNRHEELWPEHPNLDPSTWKSQKFAL